MSEKVLNARKERRYPFTVISLETFGDYGIRDIQQNKSWMKNPYTDYAVVPDDMVEAILETKGFCNITVVDGLVTEFVANKIPEIPDPDPEPTEAEQLRADIEYLAIMTGVEL